MDIIFFNQKTKKFFENIDESIKSRVGRSFITLKTLGPNLGMPYSRALGKGLFELRIVGSTHVRFIYSFYKASVWMLNGFIKKTDKIPKKEIDYARKQLRLLLQ